MWVFLWTELVIVLALALVVFKWGDSRSPPLSRRAAMRRKIVKRAQRSYL